MILRPDPPEDEELEDDRSTHNYLDICQFIKKQPISMDSYMRDTLLRQRD